MFHEVKEYDDMSVTYLNKRTIQIQPTSYTILQYKMETNQYQKEKRTLKWKWGYELLWYNRKYNNNKKQR